jgi:hypothetical protein
MSEILQVNNLGEFGVNTDVEPSQLPPEWFTNGINFKLKDNFVESFNGNSQLGAYSPSSGAHIVYYNDAGTDYYLHFAALAYRFSAALDLDITSAYMTTNPPSSSGPEYWSSCTLGSIVVTNNSTFRPEWFDITVPVMQYLPWKTGIAWPAAGKQCSCMRSHKNFLFALGMIESGVAYPYTYRWSHPADINSLPFTWDETDISAIAGVSQLAGSGGAIVDGASLRDSFLIYSERSIDALDYTGDSFVWRVRNISSDIGLLTMNCIANIGPAHIFISDRDILITDGYTVKSILTGKLKKRIFGNLNKTDYRKCFAVTHKANKEAWFFIVENGFIAPSLALVYNIETQKCYLRVVGDVSTYNEFDTDTTVEFVGAKCNHAAYGPVLQTGLLWSDAVGNWNEQINKWDYDPGSPFSSDIVAIGEGYIKTMAITEGQDYNTVLERIAYPLGGLEQVTTIKSIYPRIECNGDVSIQFGAMDSQYSATRWKDPVIFNARTMRKVDIRTTGKLHCWRFKSVGAAPFKLSGFDIEYEKNGVR